MRQDDDHEVALCVDVGSTFTKAALVDTTSGRLLGTASHATTLTTDVMDGIRACAAEVAAPADAELRVGSSAGGGLRVAVVGNEQLITAEAGRLVALSSGGRVVSVLAGGLDEESLRELHDAAPDVVLLVGGTDGGNVAVPLASARALAGWPGPVVVACNREARAEVAGVLAAAGTPCVTADNVVPRIGELQPESARAAVREVFLRHVIGGKHLSADHDFLSVVRGATPDVVLRAVELLADGHAAQPGVGELVVVDVGGATTDVYSVVEPSGEDEHAVGHPRVLRTVQGDLGVRSSAPGTVEAAVAAGWVDDPEGAGAAAGRRRDDPGLVAELESEREWDHRLAAWAVGLAVRRHAGRAQPRYRTTGPGRGTWIERAGVDLRTVGTVIGSGGVLRHAVRDDPAQAVRFAAHLDPAGGWQVPRQPHFVVDPDYVWAAAGLLAEERPEVAWALLAPVRTAAGRAPLG